MNDIKSSQSPLHLGQKYEKWNYKPHWKRRTMNVQQLQNLIGEHLPQDVRFFYRFSDDDKFNDGLVLENHPSKGWIVFGRERGTTSFLNSCPSEDAACRVYLKYLRSTYELSDGPIGRGLVSAIDELQSSE